MLSDTKITGSTTRVKLEKEGYEPLYTSISRNEEAEYYFNELIKYCDR